MSQQNSDRKPARPTPVSASRRRWFRFAAAVGLPLLLLGLAEGTLRLCGFGYRTSFFLPRQIQGQPALIDNQQFGKRFFPPGLERFPHPFVVPIQKPPTALRIFVLGESAAM